MESKIFFLIKSDQIVLLNDQSYLPFRFNEHEIYDGRICNLTSVSGEIGNYLRKNKLLGRAGIVIFDGSLLAEQLIPSNNKHVDIASHMHVTTAVNQNFKYQAILKPGMLLQYQLLFLQIGIYIETFTSEMVLQIQHLRFFTKQELTSVDQIERLQQIATGFNFDLYAKFIQAMGKI